MLPALHWRRYAFHQPANGAPILSDIDSATLQLILYSAGAGACIVLGGLTAAFTHIQRRWLDDELRHFVIALGAGILIGAVAMVLVPEALEAMSHSLWAMAFLLGGGLIFFILERYLAIKRRSAPQLTGMLLDYLPESMALGGIIASGSGEAALLAVLIGLQNLPEGFNTYRELVDSGRKRKSVLLLMVMLIPLGPLFALGGYSVLNGQDTALGAVLLLASGGILYLVFQDIAPQVKLSKHWAPPLGAVFGFALAMLGTLLTH